MAALPQPTPVGPILTTLQNVDDRAQPWLWPGRIPLGAGRLCC
jgi:hypothetical protein